MDKVSRIRVTAAFSIRQALAVLDETAIGVLLLVDEQEMLRRTVTDGDIRRLLLGGLSLDATLAELPVCQSIAVADGIGRSDALALMNQHSINHLPVLDADGRVNSLLERRELDEQILLSSPHLGPYERQYVEEAFSTNWIAPLGPNVDAFECELAAHVGIAHAAALSSGTAAIHLALRLLEVGPGDLVFCSTFTFAASANPIVYQGARPVFIDSEPESWNMSPVALERAFAWAEREGIRPRAVIVVNLYGQSADLDPILALCTRYGVPVIEDAAESLGARYKGRASGTLGLMGIYSFNGNKIITTSGGGMLVSDDEELIAKARFLATQARDPAPYYQHSQIGYNYRMSNILAGVGRGQLRVLEDRVAARRAVFAHYREALGDLACINWMAEPEWSYSTHWLSACTVNLPHHDSAAVIKALAAEGIEARHVWKPMHRQPVFEASPFFFHEDGEAGDVASRIFATGICLPSGSNMSARQQDRVIQAIRNLV